MSSTIDFATLLDILHPIGSYYETSDTTFNPNTAWGGTWVEDTLGRVTVAYQSDQPLFDQVGEIGGELTHNHQVKVGIRTYFSDAILETTNGLYIEDENGNKSVVNHGRVLSTESCSRNAGTQAGTTNFTQDGFATYTTGNTYSSNTLQPYIVVKRWHRTA